MANAAGTANLPPVVRIRNHTNIAANSGTNVMIYDSTGVIIGASLLRIHIYSRTPARARIEVIYLLDRFGTKLINVLAQLARSLERPLYAVLGCKYTSPNSSI